jgi:hypothetical protein
MSKLLDPGQALEKDPVKVKAPTAPRRYKIIASGKFDNMMPAHNRYVTKTGEGSTLRTAATDALDELLKDDRVKALRNKMPFTVVFQSGD